MAISDAQIRAAFECSNIEASYWDDQNRVLEGALLKVKVRTSEVLALSQVEMSLKPDGSSMGTMPMLLVVCKGGIAVAEEKGFFNKRIDLQSFSYKNMAAVIADEKEYAAGRGEMAIQGMVARSVPSFRIGWNWSRGGPTGAAEAAAERNRVLSVIQRAMQGDWTIPSSGQPAAHSHGSPTTVWLGADGRPLASAGPEHGPGGERLPSKREYLINWTAGLFREAGVSPVKENVERVAQMAAIGLFVNRVVGFADARPLPALQVYCRSLPGDLPDRFDQLDEIYATWIRLGTEADAQTQDPSDPTYARIRKRHIELIDQTIDSFLLASKDSFIEGIRGDYG
jgi:hypothetical protein